MAYLDSSRRASPGSMAAVIAVHAAIGAGLVAGLTVTGHIIDRTSNIPAVEFPITPPPPPPTDPAPPKPGPTASAKPASDPIVAPRPTIDLGPIAPPIDTSAIIPPRLPEILASPSASTRGVAGVVKPVNAVPSNDPARWVSDSDYRSEWSRREWTGRASFRLAIAADGRVTGCTITSSSGHKALDEATCTLVMRRARFEPARGSHGEAVAGSYTNSIVWRLPD